MRQPSPPNLCALIFIVVCGLCWTASPARGQGSPEWTVSRTDAARKNPILPGAESIARGRALFSNCVICHGPQGHGDGQAAVALNPKPKDLSSDLTQSQSDGALFWKISTGRAPMPPWEQAMGEKDRWDLVNFLRTLAAHPAVAMSANPVAAAAGASPGPATGPAGVAAAAPPVSREEFDDLQAQMRKLQDKVHYAMPGIEHFVILGDGSLTFTNLQKGSSPSTFDAVVSPLILWEPTDRLLVTTAFDLSFGTDTTGASSSSVDISIAEASVIVNDNLIVGGGLFVVPFGQYHNHFDPPWIEKLPDAPLPFGGNGIAPSSEVGLFAHGAAPLGFLPKPFTSPKVVYDAYLANGPQLVTSDPAAAGTLNFADFTDLNNGKAVGGRIGFVPFPSIEFGYSAQYGQAAPQGFPKAYTFLQAVDLNWVQLVQPLGGVFTTRAEWVWSDVQRVTYDPNGKLGFGPLNFGNYRNGGYAELAYRPTLSSNRILRNLEFIFRYDNLRFPLNSPGGEHEQRYEFGVDYWLTPTWVLKAAYAIDRRKVSPSENMFFLQLGFGM